jgi:hypothetical protein
MNSRIPECHDYTFDGMLQWFAAMSVNNFLFHPDDDPAEIVSISDSTATFSAEEVGQLRTILGRMFEQNGNSVYEAAYPAFMKRMGIQLDA